MQEIQGSHRLKRVLDCVSVSVVCVPFHSWLIHYKYSYCYSVAGELTSNVFSKVKLSHWHVPQFLGPVCETKS